MRRRSSFYFPELSQQHRRNLAAELVRQGYRAEVVGDSVKTDAVYPVVTGVYQYVTRFTNKV